MRDALTNVIDGTILRQHIVPNPAASVRRRRDVYVPDGYVVWRRGRPRGPRAYSDNLTDLIRLIATGRLEGLLGNAR